MEILSPVPTTDFTRDNKEMLMDMVRTIIMKAYQYEQGRRA
jgi:hypothetical protein